MYSNHPSNHATSNNPGHNCSNNRDDQLSHDDARSVKSQRDLVDADRRWHRAKKSIRRNHKRQAFKVMTNLVKKQYTPWTEEKKVDFVLVYKPLKPKMDKTSGYIDADPRPMDLDDVDELAMGDSADKTATMRVKFIHLLRVNGLEIEIENFTSKFEEYRAIKICGTDFAMDTWAEKFLLMKPVEPPYAHLVSGWRTMKKLHHDIVGHDDCYLQRGASVAGECPGETSPPEDITHLLQPALSLGDVHPVDDSDITEQGKFVCTSEPTKRPAKRLYPSLSGYMDGVSNWGRIRAVLDLEHDKPVDKLIAMYNENLYQLPHSTAAEQNHHSNGLQHHRHRIFDSSRYVPDNLKTAVRSMVGKFRSFSHSPIENDKVPDTELELEPPILLKKKDEAVYEESEAFKQLTFLNDRYGSLWSTRLNDWVFNLLHGDDDRLKLAKDNFVARAIRAPFNYAKKCRFLGHSEPEFYNSSERSLMVFRILEKPEIRVSEDEVPLKLKDMYREGCFEAAFPLHAGGYKMGEKKAKWSDINIGEIDNPRKLLRYFWSSSHMSWKYQPINIVKNYFGAVTAMYFAYVGFYNMTLIIPAIVGSVVFLYGIVQMFYSETVSQICNSGTKYLMCADCYIDGSCEATYISDYCFTTMITSAANNGAVIVFSIIMMLWLAAFVTFWKRQQHTIAHTWGTTNSRSASAEVRVKYTLTKCNEFRFNRATGKREHHITFFQRLPQYILAFTVIALFLSVAFMLTLTITIYNYSLSVSLETAKNQNSFTKTYANEIANVITGGISGTVILILSVIYRRIANKLTNWENHRTQKDHDNHLSFKIYLFEFVNYYGTLFYIAFFKGNVSSPSTPKYLYGKSMKVEGCAPGGCMSEVSIQMILIMTMRRLVPILKHILRTLNINRIKEELKLKLLTPLVSCCHIDRATKWRNMAKQNLEDFKNERPQFIQDFELTDPLEMYQEYANNVIQLGFLTMFVTAFPLAPLICLFVNFWQLRQDATRYVKRVRRPVGFRSEGIGSWMNILEVLSRIAILVNAVLIAFTFDYLPMIVYQRFYGDTETMAGYVDFMLATHNFTLANGTTQTCRYWSYIHPARDDHSNFWMELMLARMLFIFLFQNLVWAAVRVLELVCDSTPKSVRERMVLEEEIAQEWLSSDEDDSGDEQDGDDDKTATTPRPRLSSFYRRSWSEVI